MIRIPAEILSKATLAIQECAANATDVSGRRIIFSLDEREAEAAILGALSIVAPLGGPCTNSGTQFVQESNDGRFIYFPSQSAA